MFYAVVMGLSAMVGALILYSMACSFYYAWVTPPPRLPIAEVDTWLEEDELLRAFHDAALFTEEEDAERWELLAERLADRHLKLEARERAMDEEQALVELFPVAVDVYVQDYGSFCIARADTYMRCREPAEQ